MGSPDVGQRRGQHALTWRRARAAPTWFVFGFAIVLCGACGLAIQLPLLQLAGTCIGQGRVGTLGVAAYVCGWSLGAWLAGTRSVWLVRSLVFVALALPLAVAAATVGIGAVPGSDALLRAAFPIGVAALILPAIPMGAALPLLVRALERALERALGRAIGFAYGLNLIGSVAGAWAGGYVFPLHSGFAQVASVVLAIGLLFAAMTASFLSTADSPASVSRGGELSPGRAALLVGLATAWMLALETLVVRLGVLHFGGMQLGLSALLAAALTALSLGALVLGSWIPVGRGGVLALFGLAAVTSLWPFAFRVARAPDTWFEAYAWALVLAGPTLLPFGAVVPALHRAVSGEGGERLGRLLLHESWGALLGAGLTVQLLIPSFGIGGAIAAWTAFGVVAATLLLGATARASAAFVVLALALSAFAATRTEPALATPPLANPALAVRSFAEDEHFAVTVVDDGVLGERTLLTDGFRAAGTGRDYAYMRALAHVPLLLKPDARRVAVLALGTGTTVGAVSLHPNVERIDVLEISRAVVRAAPWFEDVNRGVLSEGLPGLLHEGDGADRVVVRLGDGRQTLREHGPYDVITMEPLLPSAPFGVSLYTKEFYDLVRKSLAPGGLMCQWVPPHALSRDVFDGVVSTAIRDDAWTGVWVFGAQVFIVSGHGDDPRFDASVWEALPEALREELGALGLETPEGLLGRQVGYSRPLEYDWDPHDDVPPGPEPRIVSDADPWILRDWDWFLSESARDVLLRLPVNLFSSPSHSRWHGLESPDLERAVRGHAALRAARKEHGWVEALRVTPTRFSGPQLAHREGQLVEHLERARELLGDDPELREFREHVEFLERLRNGVALLATAAGGQPVDARSVIDLLSRAAELRPERADVHVYNAAAFAVFEFDEAARKASTVALEACPRIAETPAGRRAVQLGLPAEYLRADAREAR